MSRALSLILLFLPLLARAGIFSMTGPADVAGKFDAANRLYEQGKFTEAASAYETLIQAGACSAPLYFNLGNALFKSGEIGRAIAAYRQADRLVPRDPDVRANLKFVRNRIQGPTLAATRFQQWLGRLTVNEWTALALVAFWAWLLLLGLTQLRPALKQSLRTIILLAGLATVTLGICLGAVLSAESGQTAIVVARDAVVRNGPLEESPTLFTVHDGAELSVLDQKDDWLQVTLGDRRPGWVKREQVFVLPKT